MQRIKVYPGNTVVRHPSAGPVKVSGSMWPSDVFTHRRIADGSVVIIAAGGGDVGEARKAIVDQVIARSQEPGSRER